jgi:NAD(P)-dependent dehydrogenase (short-subunit alcohol dehydrogenase family)
MPTRFAGKVAFITGGAIGFGRAFARALADEGAAVALADIDRPAAEAIAAGLRASAASAVALQCDVADEHSVRRAVDDAVEQLGGVDILINNAARHLKKYNQGFATLTTDEIRGLFDVNVIGVINCSLACRDALSTSGTGAIVNMSSIGGFTTANAYGVTKLAVRGLTVAFATEFAPDGIRVNAIAPALTGTESVLAEYSDADLERSITTRQLIRRRETMDDVTRTMLFLCSEDASFITGETVRVAGGASIGI